MTRDRKLAALALGATMFTIAACTVAGASAPSPEALSTGRVEVLGTWSGAEADVFRAVLAPFEKQTGITVDYTQTGDLAGTIRRRVADGDTPELAGLVGPGHMVELARQGVLHRLDGVLDMGSYRAQTAPAFVELGSIDTEQFGVFLKATLKGLIWFDPRTNHLGAPESWDELERKAYRAASATTSPWCVGLASGEASGWPGTDWIENILLRQSGTRAYDDWVAGRLAWTSKEVRRAFQTYGEVVAPGAAHGGVDGVLRTEFGAAGDGLFSDPPGCLYFQGASFMPTFFRSAGHLPVESFDFFPMPDIDPRHAGSVEVAGDLFGMLRETPESRALLRYLVTPAAQSVWVARGGALSGNMLVTEYPDPIARREAAVLQGAARVRFDASDQMPDQLNQAFWQGVIDFTRDQTRLDEVLSGLDGVTETARTARR